MSAKIKSIKRFNQSYKNFTFSGTEGAAKEEFMDTAVQMDEQGNVVEEVKYGPGEIVEEKNSYSFDKEGRLLSHTLFYALDNVSEKRVLTRNDKGLLVQETKYYGEDVGESTKYEYNEKDNVTIIERFDEEGDFAGREEMTYDEKGSLAERKSFDADRKLQGRVAFTPPTEDQVEETEYDANGKAISKTIIRFNDKGKELSTVQTNPEGKLISSIKNVYDEHGNIVEKIYKDFYSKVFKYTYDENNRLVVQELFDDSGLLLRKNLFEYDDRGNVVAEQTYEMDTTRGGRDKHFGVRYEYEFY